MENVLNRDQQTTHRNVFEVSVVVVFFLAIYNHGLTGTRTVIIITLVSNARSEWKKNFFFFLFIWIVQVCGDTLGTTFYSHKTTGKPVCYKHSV